MTQKTDKANKGDYLIAADRARVFADMIDEMLMDQPTTVKHKSCQSQLMGAINLLNDVANQNIAIYSSRKALANDNNVRALDRCFLFSQSIDMLLLNHPIISNNDFFKERIETAIDALMDVYTAIGADLAEDK